MLFKCLAVPNKFFRFKIILIIELFSVNSKIYFDSKVKLQFFLTSIILTIYLIIFFLDILLAKNPKITFEVKLGYRNKWDPDDKWTLLANSTETRDLHCTIDNERVNCHHHHNYFFYILMLLSNFHNMYSGVFYILRRCRFAFWTNRLRIINGC